MDTGLTLHLSLLCLALEFPEAASLVDNLVEWPAAKVPLLLISQLGLGDGLIRSVKKHELGFFERVSPGRFALLNLAAAPRARVAETVVLAWVGLTALLGGLPTHAFRADLVRGPSVVGAFLFIRLTHPENGLLDTFSAAAVYALLLGSALICRLEHRNKFLGRSHRDITPKGACGCREIGLETIEADHLFLRLLFEPGKLAPHLRLQPFQFGCKRICGRIT